MRHGRQENAKDAGFFSELDGAFQWRIVLASDAGRALDGAPSKPSQAGVLRGSWRSWRILEDGPRWTGVAGSGVN